jgi:SH3-like domain-containing protein
MKRKAMLLAGLLLASTPAVAGPVASNTDPAVNPIAGDDQFQRSFMSLDSSEVNMRRGPGQQYPIDWVYKRRKLPVEVVGSFDVWRKVRDHQGTEGWVLASLLSPSRTAMVINETRVLYTEPDANGRKLWRVEPGVVADIVVCQEAWCQLAIEGQTGWILRQYLWGVYADEPVR